MHHHVTVNLSAPDSPPTRLSFAQPTIHIGRVRDRQGGANDVVLAAPRVSGHHAHVVVTADGLTLIDHSANGTLVNGELLTAPRLLAPDDRVEIDAYTLTFELNAARDAPIHTPTAAPLRPPPPAPRLHPPAPSLPPPPHTATPPAPRPPLALVPEDDLPIIPTPSLSTPPCAPSNDDDDDDNATPAPPLPSPDLQRHLHQAQPVAPSPPQGPNTASDPLAALYRELAQLHGAEWGHPPPLRGHDLAQISAVAARAAARYHNLPQGPWPEHLARELCGLGPLAPLLDDPTVTRAVVHGCAPIELHRGAQRELTHLRFSCVEAIHAVLGRSGGAPPR